MLAAPLNPADINTVQGKYAVQPDSFPAVLGNEGVGEVLARGRKVKHTDVGDWVIPFLNQFGTCRSHAVAPEEDVIKVGGRRRAPGKVLWEAVSGLVVRWWCSGVVAYCLGAVKVEWDFNDGVVVARVVGA